MTTIRSKLITSVAWSLAGNWAIRGLGILKMVILARILSPNDFGVLGLALLAVNCLAVFSDINIHAALIQKRDIDRKDLDTAWTMSAARGVLLFGALFVSAGPLSEYFATPELEAVLRVVAACFILEGFTNIGVMFFARDVDFKHKVKLDVASDLAGSISAVLLALILHDFWALVWATLIWKIVNFGLSFHWHAYRPKLRWNWKRSLPLLHFGKHVFWISVVTFVVTNGDDALVGKLLGLGPLGYYALAYAIANLPVTSLCGTIGQISFPVYSHLQDDLKRVEESFQKILEAVLMFLLPLTALIMMLAESFVVVFLGDRWAPMTGVLRILCLLGLFRGLSNVIAPVFLAVNRPEIQSRNKTVELVAFCLLIYPLTARWGLIGAGGAVAAVYLVGLIMNVYALSGLLKGALKTIGFAARSPMAATGSMIVAGLLASFVASGLTPLQRFMISGAGAVAAFLSIALWMNHGAVMNACRRLVPSKCEDSRA